MGTIKGHNLRIKIGEKAIAFATSCTVHISANLEESSTKDSTNDWSEQEITGLSWDISTDALFSVDVDSNGVNATNAIDLILAKTAVTVDFEPTQGTKNRETASGVRYSGQALVNDISINATNRQNASYTLSATGTGALTKTNIVPNS